MRARILASFLPCVAAVAAAAGCAKQAPALPSPLVVEEIAIPWENAFPSDIAVDAAGRVWFTDRVTHVIGRYDPEANAFARFPTPTPKSAPYGLVASPDGVLWFAESGAGRIGRIDPRTGTITEHVLPELEGSGPHLLAWSAGRLWFTARGARRWGWLDPRTREVKSFPMPEGEGARWVGADMGAGRPYSIAPAPGGVWIGTYDGPQFYRVRAGTDTLEPIRLARTLPVDSASLKARLAMADSLLRARRAALAAMTDTVMRRRTEQGMESDSSFRRRVLGNVGVGVDVIIARRSAADAEGRLWVGDFARGRIARYDPAANEIEVYPFLEASGATYGIAVDPQGRVWSHQMSRRRITVIDPRTGERATAALASNGTVRHIAFDAKRGRVWLPISDSGRLGVIRLGRLFHSKLRPVPTDPASSFPHGVHTVGAAENGAWRAAQGCARCPPG